MADQEEIPEGSLSIKTLPLVESIACFVAFAGLASGATICLVLLRKEGKFVYKHMSVLAYLVAFSQLTWACKNLHFYLVSDARGKVDVEFHENVLVFYDLG